MFTKISSLFMLVGFLSITAFSQINVTSLDGSSVALDGQKGKVVILAIGASWVPLSTEQIAATNALKKKYAGKNVVIYFVATDSTNARSKNFASNADLEKFVAKEKLSVPLLRDPDGAATLKKLGVDQIPSFIILDKTGSKAGETFGGIDPTYDITEPISKAVDRLL
jgi:peroxiredoxin